MKRQSIDIKVVIAFLKQLTRGARIALGVLAATAGAAAAGLPYGASLVAEADAQLRSLRAQTSQTQAEARQAAMDHDYVVANTGRYKDALARGVLTPQDRLGARERLDELMRDSYLVRLGYEMAAARTEQAGAHTIVTTPMKLEISALLDRDVFGLLRALDGAFPGYGVLQGFRIARADPVDDSALRKVAAGTAVPFITATVSLDWRTARSAGEPGGEEGGEEDYGEEDYGDGEEDQ